MKHIRFNEYSEIKDIYKVINNENRLLSYSESKELEIEKEKTKQAEYAMLSKKEDNENLRLQIELQKLKQNTSKKESTAEKISDVIKKTIGVSKKTLSDEEKVKFKNFLKSNVSLYVGESNQNPLRLQEVLDVFLIRPKVSTPIKHLYLKEIERFIEVNFPRERYTITCRHVNNTKIKGWFNFFLDI